MCVLCVHTYIHLPHVLSMSKTVLCTVGRPVLCTVGRPVLCTVGNIELFTMVYDTKLASIAIETVPSYCNQVSKHLSDNFSIYMTLADAIQV